jgi:hypothetical protein
MLLHTALIFCLEANTDDQLKQIMATQPWAPSMIHGFRNDARAGLRLGEWRWRYSQPDSIYAEGGFGFVGAEWLDCEFHEPVPRLMLSPARDDLIDDPNWKLRKTAEDAWWRAIVELVLTQIRDDCHCYRIYYGQIEDEFDPGEPERAWKELICDATTTIPKSLPSLRQRRRKQQRSKRGRSSSDNQRRVK